MLPHFYSVNNGKSLDFTFFGEFGPQLGTHFVILVFYVAFGFLKFLMTFALFFSDKLGCVVVLVPFDCKLCPLPCNFSFETSLKFCNRFMVLTLQCLFNFLLLSFQICKNLFFLINLAPLFYALCIEQVLLILLFDHRA